MRSLSRLATAALALLAAVPGVGATPAAELLAEAIAYHDPAGIWPSRGWRLTFAETRPDGPGRETTVEIDLAAERFAWRQDDGGAVREGRLEAGACELRLDGSAEISAAAREEHGLTCERLARRRDYYTYLWGLPMKLTDPGTPLDPEVSKGEFAGRPALTLRVAYREPLGSDTWYFYFDPESKALVGYRFYHDETAGDGEYILLDGERAAGGLKLPAERAWYTHQGDRYLGTDTLVALEPLAR